jgi:hypothetical protein
LYGIGTFLDRQSDWRRRALSPQIQLSYIHTTVPRIATIFPVRMDANGPVRLLAGGDQHPVTILEKKATEVTARLSRVGSCLALPLLGSTAPLVACRHTTPDFIGACRNTPIRLPQRLTLGAVVLPFQEGGVLKQRNLVDEVGIVHPSIL